MSATPAFTHLHVHTHFSLLDGATRIGALVERAKAQGSSAVAITDHGNMFGAVEFYQSARKAGIKPIVGMEAYMAPGDRREKDARGMKEASYHLLLLARNRAGYQNLLRLSSIAFREGYYYKPRIDKEVLRELREGLICTSTCLGGEIPQSIMKDDRRAAEEIAQLYLDIFGEENFYIELQDHGLQEQRRVNPELADLARRLGIGTVVSNDVHYLEAEDHEAHDVLCCINTGAKFADESRFRFSSQEFYLKSPEQMHELFKQYPDALANTQRVADLCNLELEFGKRHAPVYRVPDAKSDVDYLRELVYEGAHRKYGALSDDIRQRIDYELEVISSKGFASYFLIVWDFVRYARSRGIPCGGRGSACSTVVGYCLDLSAPDPLRYELYFERFMDPDRDDMPDIDMDICQVGREEVIDYVRRKYGHVAQIITFGTLKARAAVKDVGRVLGLDFEQANAVTKLIPEELKMTIDKALGKEPELKRLYDQDPTIHRVIDISRRLEGLARHAGVHAAGVVIADQPLDNFVPLYKPADSNQTITQFDGPGVEQVGLLKMDFLGLKTLSVMERARQLAEKNHNVTIDLDTIDLTDQKVYDLFVHGDTKGVFQFESGGMREVLMKMRPNRIEDLIAANALYRPGPMAYIDSYVSRKHGEKWSTPHPIMTDVLKETYGIMVYQEQVSRLVNRLGGLELKKAFRLAKAISKKKHDMIKAMREEFLLGAEKNGVARPTAEQIFEDIVKFGDYAFNKAHSTGYALVAYKTAYLKVYYPTEYMAALLTFDKDSTDKVTEYIEECRRMTIRVSAPDINESDNDFTVVNAPGGGRQIRFGLGAIKGLGEKAARAILDARRAGGPFRSIFDFCDRVDSHVVNRGVVEALIKCGAFDKTGAMRKGLMAVLEDALAWSAAVAADRRKGQMSLFGGVDSPTRMPEPKIPTLQWSEAEMLAHEKAILGFYVTRHPLSIHQEVLGKYASSTTVDLQRASDGAEVTLGGIISKMRTSLTKKGKNVGSKMGFITVEDLCGSVEVVLFAPKLEKFQSQLALESVVFVRGRVDKKREQPCLLADEIIPLEEADQRLCTAVLVRIHCLGASHETLERIRVVLDRYPGDKPVFFEMHTREGLKVTLRLSGRRGVLPNAEFQQALAAVVGPANVVLVGQFRTRRAAAPPDPAGTTVQDAPTEYTEDTDSDYADEPALLA